MDIKELTINDAHIMFVNDTRSTRSGFKHVSTMFINGSEYGTATAYYLNRTWERYRYQTAMLKAVQEKKAERIDGIRDRYRRAQGIKAIRTEAQKQAVLDLIQSDYCLDLYNKIIAELR